MTAEAGGFKKYVQSGIELASNVRVAVDIQLTIGAASESVTVTEDAPALNTVSASAGQSISTREVENLPINGRAPMDLAVMAYGVVNTGVRDQNRPYENSGFSNMGFVNGVSTNVGATVFTRMLCGASSTPSALFRPSIACFVMQ